MIHDLMLSDYNMRHIVTELYVTINDKTVDVLLEHLPRSVKLTDYVLDAITFYNWAVEQRASGRTICSCEPALTNVRTMSTPSLDRIKRCI